VIIGKRQQGQETRTFDGNRELALVARAGASEAGWNDFASFRDEVL
jgi:hypothetical protein